MAIDFSDGTLMSRVSVFCMSFIFHLPLVRYWTLCLGIVSMVTTLLLADPSLAKAKPKFFICPTGMTRDAVAVTESFQINLCSKSTNEVSSAAVRNARNRRQMNLPVSTTDDVIAKAEISVVAMRNIKTQKQFNLPVNTVDDIIYTAKGKAYSYQFDFGRRTLTIKAANGKKTVERILSSD
jgi:hypothetical protein